MTTATPRDPRTHLIRSGVARVLRLPFALIAGALVLAVLATVGLLLGGFRPTTEHSGSMVPYLHRGDIIFSRNLTALTVRVGDVITFSDPYFKGVRLTHRVRAIQPLTDGRIAFTTKGDANTGSEYWTIPADGRLTRVSFHVPYAGSVFLWLDGRPYVIAIILIAVIWILVLSVVWRPRARRPPEVRGGRDHRPSRRGRKRTFVALAIGLVLILVPAATAAVGAITAHDEAAPVARLAVNDEGRPLFEVSEMSPGQVLSACERVTNEGPAAADVGMWGETTGTGLDRYLDLKIERGSQPAEAEPTSCSGFEPDTQDYHGLGAAVVYTGTLDQLPAEQQSAVWDPVSSWTAGSSVAYRMTVSLADDNGAQGLTAVQRFFFGAESHQQHEEELKREEDKHREEEARREGEEEKRHDEEGRREEQEHHEEEERHDEERRHAEETSSVPGNSPYTANIPARPALTAPAIGAISDSAAPNGNLTLSLSLSGPGKVRVQAALWRKLKTKVKVEVHGKSATKTKTVVKTVPLGVASASAGAAGQVRVMIKPSAAALALYRKSPKLYKVQLTITTTNSSAPPSTITTWLSSRTLGLLAKPPKKSARH